MSNKNSSTYYISSPASQNVTAYPDVNEVLNFLSKKVVSIFGAKLIGVYLTGSLSYGDFNPGRSDIDLVVIIKAPATKPEVLQIEQLYSQIISGYPKWANRVECSFTPLGMLTNILPPKEPRPYFGERFYAKATYGNEWLINNYLLCMHGITLLGPDFKQLLSPIDIKDVQQACVRDLFQEWEPKINNTTYFQNSHNQSYLVLNLCRILYTVICKEAASKKVSAVWVKKKYPQWTRLIQTAEDWEYGKTMLLKDETVNFLKFAIAEIKQKTSRDLLP